MSLTICIDVVKYEARLEDGAVVSKSDGVEFTVKDGNSLALCTCPVVELNELLTKKIKIWCQGTFVLLWPKLSKP